MIKNLGFRKLICILFILLIFSNLHAECNELGREKNPYLNQHKTNPVCWKPWSDKTLLMAKKLNKPIFLSIGYSSCYWCHVMEEESFSKKDVAILLNKYFISIKVDREERPDVDKFYMDAAYKLSGRGGWPLSAFLTPDKLPFYSGTYYKKEAFKALLTKVGTSWRKNPFKIKESADKVIKPFKEKSSNYSSIELQKSLTKNAFLSYQKYFDPDFGGYGKRLKFPPHQKLRFLLRYYKDTKDEKALAQINTTLKNMAYSGMYDHIGGGFMRYSTTRDWSIPHFEKMLYDNAQLSLIYLEAYQLTKNNLYESVAREILDFILAEMTDKKGGFYSAFDAGKIHKEGIFYTFEKNELSTILLPEELKSFNKFFKLITHNHNFKIRYILSFKEDADWDQKYNLKFFKILQKINEYREKREKPFLDKKIITAWNGLMLKSFAKGYQVLSESRYLLAAKNSANFVENNLFKNNVLRRRYVAGESDFSATLDDYAFLVDGLLTLFEASQEYHWYELALKTQEQQDEILWDNNNLGYFYVSNNNIPGRVKKYRGSALPSSNAISLSNLYKFYSYSLNVSFLDYANKLLGSISLKIKTSPTQFPDFLSALFYFYEGFKQFVLIEGTDKLSFINMKDLINDQYLPNKIFITSEVFGKSLENKKFKILKRKKAIKGLSTLYICLDNYCKEPINSSNDLQKRLKKGIDIN